MYYCGRYNYSLSPCLGVVEDRAWGQDIVIMGAAEHLVDKCTTHLQVDIISVMTNVQTVLVLTHFNILYLQSCIMVRFYIIRVLTVPYVV
jgi:hypothetical protein